MKLGSNQLIAANTRGVGRVVEEDSQFVLKIGTRVERVGIAEGELRVEDFDKDRKLIVLRHFGHSSYIGRSSGTQYSRAAISVRTFDLIKVGNEEHVIVNETILNCPVNPNTSKEDIFTG